MIKVNADNGYFDFERVDNCFNKLLEVKGIDEFTMTDEANNEIKRLLGINGTEEEIELRSIRNAVIYRFGKIINKVLHIKEDGYMDENYNPTKEEAERDFKEYKKYNMYMSATTGVIDNELYNRGFRV